MANPQQDSTDSEGLGLSQRILNGIPLADAMNFRIDLLNQQSIQVSAPLQDNFNVHGTGFAGSLFSAATLSAWALATHIAELAGINADVVMAKAEIRYKKPVVTDIICRCECTLETADMFVKQLNSRGRGRLSLVVDIGEDNEATLNATIVASIK